MNLKEVFTYRDKCLICNKELKVFINDYPQLILSLHENGIKISSSHNKGILILFNFDGTFETGRRKYGVYKDTLNIIKGCTNCNYCVNQLPEYNNAINFGGTIKFKTRGIGYSSYFSAIENNLTNLKNKHYYYSFNIAPDSTNKTYAVSAYRESIKFNDNISFWTIENSQTLKTSYITHGKFSDTIEQILNLELPIMNLSNIQTTDQLISKIKTYITMS